MDTALLGGTHAVGVGAASPIGDTKRDVPLGGSLSAIPSAAAGHTKIACRSRDLQTSEVDSLSQKLVINFEYCFTDRELSAFKFTRSQANEVAVGSN
jgi:hypothetical protein